MRKGKRKIFAVIIYANVIGSLPSVYATILVRQRKRFVSQIRGEVSARSNILFVFFLSQNHAHVLTFCFYNPVKSIFPVLQCEYSIVVNDIHLYRCIIGNAFCI